MGDALALVGLALLDSTSMGTLVIPLAIVMGWRRVAPLPLGIYLGTVVAIYFALGVALLNGFDLLAGPVAAALETNAGLWLKLVVGVALAAFGVLAPTPRKRDHVTRTPSARPLAMVALGAGAALTEAATMVPYLAATSIITTLPLDWTGRLLVLAGYCLVMVAPAIVLVALVAVFHDAIWPRLERWLPILEREAKVTLLWISAIVGVWMAASAWQGLQA